MGFAKNALIEEQQRGWASCPNKAVCAECFDDYAIAAFVKENATEHDCSYCGRHSDTPIAAEMDTVIPFVLEGIRQDWADPNNEGVSYETAEGGWLGKVVDTYDLLHGYVETGAQRDTLLADLVHSLSDNSWCQRDFYSLLPHDELITDWERFSDIVKYQTRYVFFRADDGGSERPTYEILDQLGWVIQELKMLRTLPPGSAIYRARVHDIGTTFTTAAELGPPPPKLARLANRMSPPGIPLFYGGFDEQIALAEVRAAYCRPHECVTVAKFKTLKPMTLVDFTSAPEVPSVFDQSQREQRSALIFLGAFLRSMSQPIERDGREHIDYVPTQVVTEYFRYLFAPAKHDVKGILYPSSVGDGASCVLFVDPVAPSGSWAGPNEVTKWLKLVGTRRVKSPVRRKVAKRPRRLALFNRGSVPKKKSG